MGLTFGPQYISCPVLVPLIILIGSRLKPSIKIEKRKRGAGDAVIALRQLNPPQKWTRDILFNPRQGPINKYKK